VQQIVAVKIDATAASKKADAAREIDELTASFSASF